MDAENTHSVAVCSNYSGACEHEPLTNEHVLSITKPNNGIMDGPTLFALRYRLFPCTLERRLDKDKKNPKEQKRSGRYHAASALRFLANTYHADPNSFLYKRTQDVHNKTTVMSAVYIDLNNHLAILFDRGYPSLFPKDNPNDVEPDREDDIFHFFYDMTIYHVPQNAARAETLLQELHRFVIYDITKAKLELICRKYSDVYETTTIEMKKPQITDLNLHYGDQFATIHEEFVKILQEKDSTGISIFHGPPGTGKTNYLRYLINEIEEKKFIYLPPDLVHDITKPAFLAFLIKNPNSILIIEDAENVLLDRTHPNSLSRQGVSNLLNLSDGLLGDGVHQQIICTVNCDIRSVDPALLREGRLVLEYKFDKLSIQNVRRLCQELAIPGDGEDICESSTLAEIYARKKTAEDTSSADDDANDARAKINRLFKFKRRLSNTVLNFYS